MLIKPTENYFRIIQTLIKLFSYSTVKCYEKKQNLINIAFLCSPPPQKKNIFFVLSEGCGSPGLACRLY